MYKKRLFMAVLFAGILAVPAAGSDYIRPSGISASSTLYESGQDHSAWNTQDNNLNTAWVEGAFGNGIGEYLAFSVPSGTSIDRVMVSPGYLKSEDLFYKNGAPTKLKIYSGFESRTIDTSSMANTYYRNSDANWSTYTLSPSLISNGTVYVEIMDVRPGWKYDDTCINELQLYGGSGSGFSSYSGGNSRWYQTGKTYYDHGDTLTVTYLSGSSFRVDISGMRFEYSGEFSDSDIIETGSDGSIAYAHPYEKIRLTYYPNGDYINVHTRYVDETYY